MRLTLSATILATLLTAAPAAAAPVLAPLKPCYVTVQTSPETFASEPLTVGGSGFTPGATVTVTVGEEVRGSGLLVGADGMLPTLMTDSPFAIDGERFFTVKAVEDTGAAQMASLEAIASPLAVDVRPRRAAPSKKVTFSGRGFTEPRGVFAHYLRGGKLRRTVKLAKKTAGACGVFTARRPQFPFKPEKGVWRVQIDQRRKLTGAGPLINLTIDVRRRVRTKD